MHNDIGDTLEHILFLSRHLQGLDTRHIIKVFLLELNVPAHLDGWSYLIEAIQLQMEDPNQMITKQLYPSVARRCGGGLTSGQVERTIRTVIDSAWKMRDDVIWRRYFQVMPNGEIRKPSNAVFIARIAELMDLLDGCFQAHGKFREGA